MLIDVLYTAANAGCENVVELEGVVKAEGLTDWCSNQENEKFKTIKEAQNF